jgi:glycosyltransferase involved in cell wall biosynthesis
MTSPRPLTGNPALSTDLISIVVPVHDEQAVLPEFHRRLSDALGNLGAALEIIYVNDGSRDASTQVLRAIRYGDTRVAVLELSRNFGKEAALSAGLDYAAGDAVVIIDADLQDPPELIPQAVAAWRDGEDVVTFRRLCRDGEPALRRFCAHSFYRLLSRLSRAPMPVDVGDFRLLSRRAVDALKQLPERNRYMKGLFAWVGFSPLELTYERAARAAGHSHWSLLKLLGLALDGITSFTWAPLRLATVAGAITAVGALGSGTWILLRTLFLGDPVPGYPSLMCVILFLGGMQLLAIGIQGEYLGRLFEESKQRPLYLLKSVQPAAAVRARREQASP